jgi:hypothetical protein
MIGYFVLPDTGLRSGRTPILNLCTKSGETALIAAAKGGHPRVIAVLLKHSADVETGLLAVKESPTDIAEPEDSGVEQVVTKSRSLKASQARSPVATSLGVAATGVRVNLESIKTEPEGPHAKYASCDSPAKIIMTPKARANSEEEDPGVTIHIERYEVGNQNSSEGEECTEEVRSLNMDERSLKTDERSLNIEGGLELAEPSVRVSLEAFEATTLQPILAARIADSEPDVAIPSLQMSKQVSSASSDHSSSVSKRVAQSHPGRPFSKTVKTYLPTASEAWEMLPGIEATHRPCNMTPLLVAASKGHTHVVKVRPSVIRLAHTYWMVASVACL